MNLIAFVSQRGNVMKSTLATAMALEAVHNDLKVKLADLDNEHRTIEEWIAQRAEYGIEPMFDYFTPNSADEALKGFSDENLCIIDAPSRATEATLKIAAKADLVVQPVTAWAKDLKLAIKLFYQLIQNGILPDKLVFVLVRIGWTAELKRAKAYLNKVEVGGKKIKVVSSTIAEQVGYRTAISDGLAITETPYPSLNESAKAVIHQILTLLIH